MLCNKHWTAAEMPDQTNRVHLVTGANTGIGYETAKALLVKNAKVYIAARSSEKGLAAIERLKQETGKEALFLSLDLADLKSVRRAAQEFQKKENHLDVLFNNAGIMATLPTTQVTADGYELQFGTNTLGHFFFTTLLLPLLLASSPPGRVINTTSMGHNFVPDGGIDFSTLNGVSDAAAEGSCLKPMQWTLYGQSKLGNILFSNELARRYGSQGLIAHSVHPGAINTELTRNMGSISTALVGLVSADATLGAVTQLFAGTAPENGERNGMYFVPWAAVGTPSKYSNDVELAGKFWKWCEDEIKKY